MDKDFIRISMIQKEIEKNYIMTFTMKGVALLLTFTVLVCCNDDFLGLYIAIPAILILFLLDLYFRNRKRRLEEQMSEISGTKTEDKLLLTIVCYTACLLIIIGRLAILKQ